MNIAKYMFGIMLVKFILLGVSMFLVGKYSKKKLLKISLLIIISFLIVYCVMLSIDMNRVNSLKKPIFARKNGNIGSMVRYDGLGYKIGLEMDANTGYISQSQMTMFGNIVAAAITNGEKFETGISIDILEKLFKTNKIVIMNDKVDGKNTTIGTIIHRNIIEEIISIISKATGDMNGNFNCKGTALYFEMYDVNNKLIDTIDIWLDGNVMPRSIAKYCSKYSLTSEATTALNTVIEQQTGTKFFSISDYSESCDDGLELIYEDDKYEYYFECIKSDKVFIEFTTTKLKINVKEALKNKYITIDELTDYIPHLFIKQEK